MHQFVEVSVEDTGAGIAEEDQDKLFKLFGFIQSTENVNKNGIGLGLVISD
jgi:signal transduction histidine kinase